MPPITLAVRLVQAGVILAGASLILGVGVALLRAIGKSSASRYRHGRFVLGWMLAGWIGGGLIGVCLLDNVRHYPNEADTGMAGFGLLLGWAVGMAHGGAVLAVWTDRGVHATPSSPGTGGSPRT